MNPFFDNYEPKHFEAAYRKWGARIASRLTPPESLGRMDAAVALVKTPAQAVAELIVAEFGAEAKNYRLRQLVGHMICHLMTSRGFELDKKEVRIRDGVLFTRAARYRRRHSEFGIAPLTPQPTL